VLCRNRGSIAASVLVEALLVSTLAALLWPGFYLAIHECRQAIEMSRNALCATAFASAGGSLHWFSDVSGAGEDDDAAVVLLYPGGGVEVFYLSGAPSSSWQDNGSQMGGRRIPLPPRMQGRLRRAGGGVVMEVKTHDGSSTVYSRLYSPIVLEDP